MTNTKRSILCIAGGILMVGLLLFGIGCILGARPAQLWQAQELNLPWWSTGNSTGISSYRNWHNEFDADGSYTVDAAGITALDLKWLSGSVEITISPDNTLRFSESARRPISKATALRYGVENGTLCIQFCEKGNKQNLFDKALVLSLPRDLAAELDLLQFDGVSASLTLKDIAASDLMLSSVSGDIKAEEMVVSSARLESTSGNLRFHGSYQTLDADSTSGNITVESTGYAAESRLNATSGTIKLAGNMGNLMVESLSGTVKSTDTLIARSLAVETTSGEISLNGNFSEVLLDTLSGDIDLTSSDCPDTLNGESTSGNITLTLPEESAFALIYETISGTLYCDFSVHMQGARLIYGNGTSPFEVDTTSGNLALRLLR